jgi:hypothetical protein
VALAFEQQAKESDKAFAAFSMYLSLGPQRSLSVTAEKLGKSKRMMEKWSKRFDWLARVQAHGAHMALVEREAAEALARAKGVDWVKRQEEHREEEWRVRCELMEAAQGALKRLTKSDRCWSPEGIARLVELASELGRRACEMATEKAEVTGVVKVEVEIEAALKKVYGEDRAVQPPREIPELHEQVVDIEEVGSGEGRVASAGNGQLEMAHSKGEQ